VRRVQVTGKSRAPGRLSGSQGDVAGREAGKRAEHRRRLDTSGPLRLRANRYVREVQGSSWAGRRRRSCTRGGSIAYGWLPGAGVIGHGREW
jgi:hypothetical protein